MKNRKNCALIVKEFKMKKIKLPYRVQFHLETIMGYAKEHDWKCIGFYEVTSHVVLAHRDKNQQMNVYLTTMTVQTIMKHPGRKKVTQLNRKGLDIFTIEKLFKNVRTHTGKGYYVKK